jgi:hypothetical protein
MRLIIEYSIDVGFFIGAELMALLSKRIASNIIVHRLFLHCNIAIKQNIRAKRLKPFYRPLIQLFIYVLKPNYVCFGSRPLGRPRRMWVDNIKIDLVEIGWVGVDWIDLAQDRDKWRDLVKAVMNPRVP